MTDELDMWSVDRMRGQKIDPAGARRVPAPTPEPRPDGVVVGLTIKTPYGTWSEQVAEGTDDVWFNGDVSRMVEFIAGHAMQWCVEQERRWSEEA